MFGVFLGRFVSNGIHSILITKKIDNTISGFLSTLINYTIITFSFIAILERIGVQANSVITVLGAAGMAVGLALQGSLANFAAGVLLVTFRPLKTGEYVNFGLISGTVIDVHIFYTILRTLDGKRIVIPNGKIISGNIVNYSREPIRRNEFSINVSYDSDVDVVIKILKKVLKKEKRIIHEKGTLVGLKEFAPSSLNFKVRCWSYTKDLNSVYWDLMLKFKKTLDKNHISIPNPQMDIYLYQKNKKKFKRKIWRS